MAISVESTAAASRRATPAKANDPGVVVDADTPIAASIDRTVALVAAARRLHRMFEAESIRTLRPVVQGLQRRSEGPAGSTEVVDDVGRQARHVASTDMTTEAPPPPTLHEWAGGTEALRRMIDAFYDRVEQLELFTPLFPGGVSEEHRDFVTAWWVEVFGGPPRYTADLGGYAHMLQHHRNLRITPDQRAAFVSVMSLAADDARLPSDPEFRSALMSYLEWGTRLAFANSQVDAIPVEHAPVPRWGWGEAPPYTPS